MFIYPNFISIFIILSLSEFHPMKRFGEIILKNLHVLDSGKVNKLALLFGLYPDLKEYLF